jgi:hypothetical protein
MHLQEKTMLLQLEQQYLRASLAQAKAFLADANLDDDPIGKHQFAQLVGDLSVKLDAMPQAIERAPAGVALFFGGRPVIGSQGIHAEFTSKALDGFQKIVSQRFASEELGPLASKGRVPLKDNTHLLITDVVRGSFGFVLQAAGSDSATRVADTSLKAVVDKVASTISRVAAQDDKLFDEAVAEIDERQKSSLSEFFKLLDTEGATMRLVEGERDFELDSASVQRARRRVEQIQIVDRTQEFTGQIVGWADYSAKFELWLHDTRDVIQGSVLADALDGAVMNDLEPYHKHVRANCKVREVKAHNRTPKVVYTLVSLEIVAAPENWERPVGPVQISADP